MIPKERSPSKKGSIETQDDFARGSKHLAPTSSRKPDKTSDRKIRILNERLRQASLGFNLAAGFLGGSSVITLVGFCLLFFGHPQGVSTAAGGFASTAISGRCMQLAKEANDRLDRLIKDLGDEQDKQ